MEFSFEAEICKVGINPCVEVPYDITRHLKAAKGYIPVRGTINGFPFQQTLVPVKNSAYRLYVNGPMLKGSGTKVGDTAKFLIEQDPKPKTTEPEMPAELEKELSDHGVLAEFRELLPGRRKEILKYYGFLKTEESRKRNREKVVNQLKK